MYNNADRSFRAGVAMFAYINNKPLTLLRAHRTRAARHITARLRRSSRISIYSELALSRHGTRAEAFEHLSIPCISYIYLYLYSIAKTDRHERELQPFLE